MSLLQHQLKSFILRSQVGRLRFVTSNFGFRTPTISTIYKPKTPPSMGNINARGGKMGFGKKTKPVSVGDVWGGIVSKEKEEMEFRGAKELDKREIQNWSRRAEPQHGSRSFSTTSTSSTPPPTPPSSASSSPIDYATQFKADLESAFTSRSKWKDICGMIGSESFAPPSAVKCLEDVMDEEEGERQMSRRVVGESEDINDFKF